MLAVLTVALLVAADEPAWAWQKSMPGGEHWPAIPEPGGMANFLGTWLPQCRHDAWTDHGNMTLHEGGRISYEKKKPYLATRYRVIETTPHYVVLMTREAPWKQYGEILRFVVLQSVSPEPDWPRATLGWNECRPQPKDLAGFSWADDDAALARVWAGAKSCNPEFKIPYEGSPFFGNRGWSQECKFNRIEPESRPHQ
ncbi:MAG: hypothetical protein H7Z12_09910 [Rhodospirillaceae bacterium]|nr:hypothetical protein [Rhodospirillales bacterium]